MTETKQQEPDVRREWIEPDVSELKVSETSGLPTVGGDGGAFADCSRS